MTEARSKPSDTEALRVAVIGYGLAGRVFHARVLSSVPGLRLTAAVTSSADRAAAARVDHPAVEVLNTPESLWERTDIDIVVVATPNRSHAGLALRAIEHGYAVVVDKPMALSQHEISDLTRRASETGVVLCAFQNRRWDGDFLTVRALLEADELGELRQLESRFERSTGPQGWRLDEPPELGGGILWDLGPHLIDQAVLLAGPVTSVYAELAGQDTIGCDQDAFVSLTHESGVRSHVFASWVTAGPSIRLRACGTRATYQKFGEDPQERTLLRELSGDRSRREETSVERGEVVTGSATRPVPTLAGDYAEFYRQMERAVRGSAEPPVSMRDVLHTTAVIEAARRSALDGQVVDVVTNVVTTPGPAPEGDPNPVLDGVGDATR